MPSSSPGKGPRDVESQKHKKRAAAGSPLTKYFLVVLFGASTLSLVVNNKYASTVHRHEDSNVVHSALKNFRVSDTHKMYLEQLKKVEAIGGTATATATDPPDDESKTDDNNDNDNDDNSNNNNNDDGDTELHDPLASEKEKFGMMDEEKDDDGNGEDDGNEKEEEDNDDGDGDGDDTNDNNDDQQEHTIANLNCEAYGGPSNKDAEEMVYWEDIPKDALHMSPFHAEHPQNNNNNNKQSITQFLTFEPDAGGWNNIRMAMETVFTLAFAMGRTLVLPPHQGMYLIDKGGEKQKNKFSFDHFFHTESISNEHVGLNIITTTEFLEQCAEGKIIDADGKPIHPPQGRTDWDGAAHDELRSLKLWIREVSGENLLHWDPDNCIAAFPASNSEQDTNDLLSLPDKIEKLPGGFPQYQNYIGKPTDVDAPAMERLKEMNAGRHQLCTYTPELQQKQWLHFPCGMKTEDGDSSRLLVHFYAFLFFQDWKQDLWMKRFVRDHVRYIDEIQCAAARVVTGIRKKVSSRTKGASKDFDTIHIRRGDFQFKETRVDATIILEQLKKVLSDDTTLYIATDERDKSFFKPITNHYPQVLFLDDLLTEIEGINTNYYGMIDQLVASRGKNFFGCWFSSFTGYINRLRGYYADDNALPGYEQGIIQSYYYAMPDRFDHMKEFWPIKKQFYAREFPASWRLIDSSI